MLTNYLEQSQNVLDELLREDQIPFPLTAQTIEPIGPEEYLVRFYDSRLRSVEVTCPAGKSFADAFRVEMLSRIQRLAGPRSRTANMAM